MIYTFEVSTTREDLKKEHTNLNINIDMIKQQEDNCCFFSPLVELLNDIRICESIDF